MGVRAGGQGRSRVGVRVLALPPPVAVAGLVVAEGVLDRVLRLVQLAHAQLRVEHLHGREPPPLPHRLDAAHGDLVRLRARARARVKFRVKG